MEPNARIQTLALVLLGAFAWLCFDLGSVKEAVSDYLDDVNDQAPVTPSGRPTLVGGGEPAAGQEELLADSGGGGGRIAPLGDLQKEEVRRLLEDAARDLDDLATYADVVRAHLTPDRQVVWDRFDPHHLIDRGPIPARSLEVRTARGTWNVRLRVRG